MKYYFIVYESRYVGGVKSGNLSYQDWRKHETVSTQHPLLMLKDVREFASIEHDKWTAQDFEGHISWDEFTLLFYSEISENIFEEIESVLE